MINGINFLKNLIIYLHHIIDGFIVPVSFFMNLKMARRNTDHIVDHHLIHAFLEKAHDECKKYGKYDGANGDEASPFIPPDISPGEFVVHDYSIVRVILLAALTLFVHFVRVILS